MKNLHLLLIAFIAPLLAFSTPQVAKLTVVEGHVYNHSASPESKTIIINIPDITFWHNNTIYFTQVDKNDNFKITFKLYVAQDAQLLQEGLSTQPLIQDFIIHPGDKIHINLDFKTLTNISFSGSAAKTNNDLFNYTTHEVNLWQVRADSRLYNAHDEDKYKTAVYEIKSDLIRKTEAFEAKAQVNRETKDWLNNNINLFAYNSLTGHYSLDHKNDLEPVRFSTYAGLKPADINAIFNNRLINAEAYKLVFAFLPKHTEDDVFAKYSPQFLSAIDDTAKKYNNKLLGDLIRGKALCTTLFISNTADFYKNKDVFDSIKSPFIKEALAKRYNLAKYDNHDHNSVISSYNKQLEGTLGGKVLDSLIAANKNKVIYVDFWATWCEACIGEMPNSRKMAQKYQGKDVMFVYVCLKSPKELWAKMAPGLRVEGDHIYCDDDQSKSLYDKLKVNGLPFYLLINKNGEIVEASDLARPGKYFTERKLNSLLE